MISIIIFITSGQCWSGLWSVVSVMVGPSLCPASRASQCSTSPAMQEEPISGAGPKKMMWGLNLSHCFSICIFCLSVILPYDCLPICPPQTFTAPSFDDKILEVVAVFGSMQMAVSRVINLQHHRIAQVQLPVSSLCFSSYLTLSICPPA